MAKPPPTRLSRRAGRNFGSTVGGAFLALGGVVWWRGHDQVAVALGSLGVLLVASGLLIPGHLGPVHRAWMGFARAISKVTTPVIMGGIYFVVLAPVGLVMRAFGRNPLTAHRRPHTLWVARESEPRSDLKRQF